ncbi:MAG: T9SS type A sorting domain-containing protein [Chitinophagales bacterium]|nr:T9SS type A sorting domain-containing protein [Chitinophagales bacterium]
MNMRIFHLFLGLLLTNATFAQNTITGTIQSGGLTREYLLYIPAAYTGNTAVPLIFNLHGYTSSNLEQMFYADFRPIADTANFLIVLPNGTIDAQGNRHWNTFIGNSNVDDVGFIRDLLNSLESTYNIDANRVYSTGMSNGGFMSYSLACELNDRITAIASVTGSMIQSKLNACNPARPVPVMEIHGTSDNTVPYNGLPAATFVSIPALLNTWAGLNNCNPVPTITPVPNNNTTDGCTAERQIYTGGEYGSTVEHFKVIGGGHTWPGSAFNIGITNQDFSACKEIWRFFSQYQLDQLSETHTPEFMAKTWTAFPNPAQNYFRLQSTDQRPVKRIQIFDAMGRLQQTVFPNNNNHIDIETSNWAVGIYGVIIEQEASVTLLKVVKTGA